MTHGSTGSRTQRRYKQDKYKSVVGILKSLIKEERGAMFTPATPRVLNLWVEFRW